MKTTIIRSVCCVIVAAIFASCEKPIFDETSSDSIEPKGNAVLTFAVSTSDAVTTRAGTATALSSYAQRLAVMLFTPSGERVFTTVKTQTADDDGFGTMVLSLAPGDYTLVAVAHSSAVTPTIKSPQMVQFTAKDGRKLTDTFVFAGPVTVTDQPVNHDITLTRAVAMVRFSFTDEQQPATLAAWDVAYSGGSANVNPTTLEGTTKSSQSETRTPTESLQVYTFPYLAAKGTLKMTVQAADASDNIIRSRVFTEVPVTRNRITTWRGRFFDDTDTGEFIQSTFGFTVNGEWDGEDVHDF